MGQTTFSGPVESLNGFLGGTSASPVSKTTAGNINAFYGTTSATTGDTRLFYEKLTFTSTGSGETLRAFSTVTGANGATGGTINGAHISMSITGSGTISGAGNALRATLGFGASTTPGGTLSAIQVDSDFDNTSTVPAGVAGIRFTNSNTKTFAYAFRMPAPAVGGVLRAVLGSPTCTHTIPVYGDNGTVYYIMASTTA